MKIGWNIQAQTRYPLSLEWPGILIKAAHISDILSLIFKKYVGEKLKELRESEEYVGSIVI